MREQPIERCCKCDEPTGRAGRDDDSMYRDDGTGPYCEDCYEGAPAMTASERPVLHVLRTTGYYIGQVRYIGCRNWRTVTPRYNCAQKALAKAVTRMGRDDKRARALYVPTGDTGSYYEPTVAMEAKRQ